jgi:alpha-tubulin suppressor-like RCC1 family protein
VSAQATSQADWDAVVAEIEATTDADLPAADAGGPYLGAPGATLALDATGSTTATGTTITGYAWDLDGDSQFDDANGATPNATVPATGASVVSVRVTNDAGLASVDHAVLGRTSDAPAPAITAVSPAPAATVVVGAPETFSVTATATDGGALSYQWILDGTAVGTGASFVYDPTEADANTHTLAVEVTAANGRSATRAWRVTVTTVDADDDGWASIADCDDDRTDIHPGRFEQLGNGIDDDCDAGTPDAPPGGLTGAVWTWGHNFGLGNGSFADSHTPTANPALPAVVQVESSMASGVAVLPDGTVRTWGTDGRIIGDGTQTGKRTPTSPRAVGGAPGSTLSGVVRVSSEQLGVIALRADGSVIAWGENMNGQVGDLSDVNTRLYPVEVVTQDGTPVTGAIDVEQGEQTNYILMADGTVWTVGVPVCQGGTSFIGLNYAIPAPLFGDDIVQIEAGDAWVVARKADGSLVSCGPNLSDLGRGTQSQTMQSLQTPKPMVGFGPGERNVVDISAGMSTGVAVTEDGAVWMWGRNLNGEMNAAGVTHGHTRFVAIPVAMPAGAPVVAVDHDDSTTTIAMRADGSAVTWGGNYFGNAGTGSFSPNPAVGFHTMAINGHVIDGAVSVWNSLALVRPANDPTWERPLQWLDTAASDATIGESTGGTVPVTLSAAAPAGQDVEVQWAFAGQTGTATIPAGQTQVDVAVAVIDDELDEDDELLPFSVESVSNGVRVERGTAMVTVVDDDAAPTVSIGSTIVDEGDTSLTDATVAVSLSAPSSHDVVVTYTTHDGTAIAGDDYAAATGSIVVPAGATATDLHLAVTGDLAVEPHESFTVTLDAAEHATLDDATGAVDITDDEPVVLTMTSPTVSEGDTGTTPASFAVTAAAVPPGATVSVPWTIVPGTAEDVVDVVTGAGSIALDADSLSATVETSVVADEEHEQLTVEVFRLVLGAAIASDGRPVVPADPGVASILDDDPLDTAPVVSAGDDASGPEGSPVAISGTVVDDGPVTTTWSTDAAGCTIADAAALATTVTCADDEVAVVTLTADDGEHPAVTDTVTVAATNVAPVISASGYTSGALQATFSDAAADTHRCVVVPGDGSPGVVIDPATSPCTVAHAYAPGSHTATITVVDDDGGEATATITVQNQSEYVWDGFFQPIDNGVINTVNAGRAIPVKFSLGGDFGLDIFADGSPASVPIACNTGLPVDAVEETVTPGSSDLTYANGRYQYVWKTNRAWAGQCRMLIVTLADGSEHTALFRFR